MNRRSILAPALLALLVLPACSSGGSPAPAPGTTSHATTSPGSPSTSAPSAAPSTTTSTATVTETLPPSTVTETLKPAPADGTPDSPAPSPGGPCTYGQLEITLGQMDSATGKSAVPIVFKNASKDVCTMRGYPGLDLQLKDGRSLSADRSATSPVGSVPKGVETISLKPGQAASSLVGFSTLVPNGDGECQVWPTLLTTPPGEVRS